jgi:hypothetical protein
MESDMAVPDDPIKETLALIRAQSTIRFVALPFLFGANGLLARAFFANGEAVPPLLIAATGLGLGVVAVVVEIVLSRNLLAWWTALAPLLDAHPAWQPIAAHRDRAALNGVRWALFLPYLVALDFWLYHCLDEYWPAVAGREAGMGLILLLNSAVIAAMAMAAWRSAAEPG